MYRKGSTRIHIDSQYQLIILVKVQIVCNFRYLTQILTDDIGNTKCIIVASMGFIKRRMKIIVFNKVVTE